MIPKKIKLVDNDFLYIKWDDDSEQKIKLANLRYNCPCALCENEKLERSSKYIPIYSDEQIQIKEIKLIGNYAVNIVWKDNHDTGIYDFDYLKRFLD